MATCELDEVLWQGAFRHRERAVTEELGARVIGATIYEMDGSDKRGPYHFHQGVEEWVYVVSGSPVLRDPSGERVLLPGELVAFASGPKGAHTVHGPGRIVMFSTGALGWGEAFVTVYPDSDKISAKPGVMFRRGDALESWGADDSPGAPPTAPAGTSGPVLGGETWSATPFRLAPGEATGPYHYEWCREEWALVLAGAPALRGPDGEEQLTPGDLVCFPEGPEGAHRLANEGAGFVRLLVFSTPRGTPMSAVRPDDSTVLIRLSDDEGFLFRAEDEIEDYWDGEPGAVE